MIKELTKLANHLDSKGLRKEADYLDSILRKTAYNKPGNWGFETEGDEAWKVYSTLHSYVFKRGKEAYDKLNALGTDPWTITFDIREGKVTANVDPQTNQQLVATANEIASIIENTTNRDTGESIVSPTYRSVKKKLVGGYKMIIVKRPPATVVISTATNH